MAQCKWCNGTGGEPPPKHRWEERLLCGYCRGTGDDAVHPDIVVGNEEDTYVFPDKEGFFDPDEEDSQ